MRPGEHDQHLKSALARAAGRLRRARGTLPAPARIQLDTVIDAVEHAPPPRWPVAQKRAACRHLPGLLDEAGRHDTDGLTDDIAALVDVLHWTQTYRSGPVGTAFFESYGHAALVGPAGPATRDDVKLGIILVGPGLEYPDHAHPAGEFYLLLAGHPRWRIGRGAWHDRGPGDLIHHAPEEAHATRTCATGLLALYAWYGDIDVPPRFV